MSMFLPHQPSLSVVSPPNNNIADRQGRDVISIINLLFSALWLIMSGVVTSLKDQFYLLVQGVANLGTARVWGVKATASLYFNTFEEIYSSSRLIF